MQSFFQVTPPAVHDMVLTLELRGLIERTPGKARSIKIVIPPEALPNLQDPAELKGSGRRLTRG